MKWCKCGHASTSHEDEYFGCRSLVFNLAGQSSDCACTQMDPVQPERRPE